MKKLILLTFCLSLISFQAAANRPAEEDLPANTDSSTEATSNIPVPEQVEQGTSDSTTTADTQNTEADESTAADMMQNGDVIQRQETPARPQITIIDFPSRGMNMSKVLNELGEPTIRHPAIGKPPITRWVYPDRTVFFEYSHVIHVVVK